MDFPNRGQQINVGGTGNRPNSGFSSSEPASNSKSKSHKSGGGFPNHSSKWVRLGGGLLIILIAILIGAALALFFTFKPANQGQYVDTNKMQAVFLTNNQVYFGKIVSSNHDYLVLQGIYYLQSASTTSKSSNSNVSLIKLGCELHKPSDQMVINQSQVTFWENLQTDGQVAKAVTQYQKANPNGQTCSNSASNSATGTSVQGSSSTNSSSSSDSSNSDSSSSNNSSDNSSSDTTNQ